MALTKFKLVNHEGMSGLHYKGRTIPFDKIDDKLAEELLTKTHVLERLSDKQVAKLVATTAPAAN
jgi:hypothetical protein